MAEKSDIEWTDSTWNPTRGCTRVSPGCVNCYAEVMAARFSGPGQWGEGFAAMKSGDHRWSGKVALVESALTLPLRWKTPRKIFVNSTSDLFHESLPIDDLWRVFAVMAQAPQHTFQILTKRHKWMEILCRNPPPALVARWPLPNVWLGTSVEDQERADERIPHLLATPAAVRFLSCEPLLGPIDLTRWMRIAWQCSYCRAYFSGSHKPTCPDCGALGGWSGSHAFNGRQNKRSDVGSGIDWIIAGGESGPKARPMHPDWARSLRDQCWAGGAAFFHKQNGEFASCGTAEGPGAIFKFPDGAAVRRVGKVRAGRLLDGWEWSEFPRAAA